MNNFDINSMYGIKPPQAPATHQSGYHRAVPVNNFNSPYNPAPRTINENLQYPSSSSNINMNNNCGCNSPDFNMQNNNNCQSSNNNQNYNPPMMPMPRPAPSQPTQFMQNKAESAEPIMITPNNAWSYVNNNNSNLSVSGENIECLNDFLRTQIGKKVEIQFFFSDGNSVEKVGTLIGVGSNYILLLESNTNDILAANYYQIRFVTFLADNTN